ncbi:DUF4327 family protein [Alkalinema pantanalense CENA528]|uniref:DUF4327 family protein n=1 Tax=Alkalinema pantanalense TaxID=1620705 RepID=UPI003D6E4500
MYTVRLYSIEDLRDEVKSLVDRGLVSRQHCIYELIKHFSDQEWLNIERVLEENEYLLRDRVIDLVGKESWVSD